MPQVEALQSAFLALLEIAEEARAEDVLKRAIAGLVASAENRPLVQRGPPVDGADLEAWTDLKAQLRGSLVALAQIARDIGLSKSAVDHILSPAERAPSKTTFDKLKGWLATRDQPEAAMPPATAPIAAMAEVTDTTSNASKANGHSAPAAKANGHMPPPPRRLDQRERIALKEAYGDLGEQQLRRRFGVTPELLGRAVAGGEMPGEVHQPPGRRPHHGGELSINRR